MKERKMKHYGKSKVIKISNPDCKNIYEMQQNYSGLWRALGLQVTTINKGFVISNKECTYQLEA